MGPGAHKPLPRHTGQEVLISETERDEERRASQRAKSKAWRSVRWSAGLSADERSGGKEGADVLRTWSIEAGNNLC